MGVTPAPLWAASRSPCPRSEGIGHRLDQCECSILKPIALIPFRRQVKNMVKKKPSTIGGSSSSRGSAATTVSEVLLDVDPSAKGPEARRTATPRSD